jgi:hypothetical protein
VSLKRAMSILCRAKEQGGGSQELPGLKAEKEALKKQALDSASQMGALRQVLPSSRFSCSLQASISRCLPSALRSGTLDRHLPFARLPRVRRSRTGHVILPKPLQVALQALTHRACMTNWGSASSQIFLPFLKACAFFVLRILARGPLFLVQFCAGTRSPVLCEFLCWGQPALQCASCCV